jgi:hypothetical protein
LTSRPIAAYGAPSSTSWVAGRPMRRSVSPVSRISRRSIRSATRLDTVALFSPVEAAMSAREQGALARTKRSTTARLVARTSAKSAGCGPVGMVIKVGPPSANPGTVR